MVRSESLSSIPVSQLENIQIVIRDHLNSNYAVDSNLVVNRTMINHAWDNIPYDTRSNIIMKLKLFARVNNLELGTFPKKITTLFMKNYFVQVILEFN